MVLPEDLDRVDIVVPTVTLQAGRLSHIQIHANTLTQVYLHTVVLHLSVFIAESPLLLPLAESISPQRGDRQQQNNMNYRLTLGMKRKRTHEQLLLPPSPSRQLLRAVVWLERRMALLRVDGVAGKRRGSYIIHETASRSLWFLIISTFSAAVFLHVSRAGTRSAS